VGPTPRRRPAASDAHGKPHGQQRRQQQHPQAVFDQHLDAHPRAGLLSGSEPSD
jgi:hypothetical protein